MRVGVGLPSTVQGTRGDLLLEWARRADAGPFSSLGVLDRVVYDSYDPLIALAGAAAVTHRVRLATTIVIGPLRNTTLLARSAASLDALSGGRLTLGLAIGARQDDYEATGIDYHSRGKRMVEQLSALRAYWEEAEIGPRARRPGGPELLVGGLSDRAFARVARYADGYVHGGGPPRAFARVADKARAAWLDAGRPGMPHLWAQGYFALGETAEAGARYLRDYYAFTGGFVEKIVEGMLTTPQSVAQFIRGYAEAGCDELVLFPTVADLDQLDRLAEVVSDLGGGAAPASRERGADVVKIQILGGGPAGLYCGLLLKKANPDYQVTVLERNAPDATYGWGVVFSDRTLAAFQEADLKSYHAIRDRFVLWDAIDIYNRGTLIHCGGHVFAGLARKQLLGILQQRCGELGVALRYHTEMRELAALEDTDLIIAADGVNSLARSTYADAFRPSVAGGQARYIWFGAEKVLDAFTFIFRENEAGLFQVHSYPFNGTTSTVIVECAETTWRRAGLEGTSEAESIAYCERLFAEELGNTRLLSNNSRWITFVTVKNARWSHRNVVLLGDAAHTAHFSIGSGTKLAMEDAIALATAVTQHPVDMRRALRTYELDRKPVVEAFQRAAAESQSYFEHVDRYAGLPPLQFAFNLLTRSGRVSYDDLRLRDPRFGARVDREFPWRAAPPREGTSAPLHVPPPVFTPIRLRETCLSNRIACVPATAPAEDGRIDIPYVEQMIAGAHEGAGLVLSMPVAISEEGRVSPDCAGLYAERHVLDWAEIARAVHDQTTARVGVVLSHAGRRGATRPRHAGLDRPLREWAWPLVAPSPLPYTAASQTPRGLDRGGMDRVRDDFARAAFLAAEAGIDLLQLHMGHGYLLAGFLSPLSNRREDEYGGALERRMRFPLEVFDAVRAVWPAGRPLAVALTVDDCVKGGLELEDGVVIARALREHGCDLLTVLVGHSTPEAEPSYGRGFLTPFSDRVRNEAGIPTLVGGYLTTTNEANTILAGGRADICLLTPEERPRLEHVPGAVSRRQETDYFLPGPAVNGRDAATHTPDAAGTGKGAKQ